MNFMLLALALAAQLPEPLQPRSSPAASSMPPAGARLRGDQLSVRGRRPNPHTVGVAEVGAARDQGANQTEGTYVYYCKPTMFSVRNPQF